MYSYVAICVIKVDSCNMNKQTEPCVTHLVVATLAKQCETNNCMELLFSRATDRLEVTVSTKAVYRISTCNGSSNTV